MNVSELFNLIKNQKWNNIKSILKNKNNNIDVNIRDNNKNYLMHYAILYNNIEITELLLENNAKIDIIDIDGRCILYYPVKYNYYDMLSLLLIYNKKNIGVSIIDIVDKDGNTPLHYSIFFTNIDMVKLLLKNNADVNIKNNRGYNALHMAIYVKNIELCKIILNYNIYIDAVTNTGETPLHLATTFQLYDICELLLINGVDPNINDFDNELTSIIYSVVLNDIKLFKLLLKYNASLILQDIYGNSALHYIIIEDNIELFKIAIEYDINPNIYNINSKIPIHIALELLNKNTLYYVTHLIEKSDVNVQNNHGNTIMHLLSISDLWKDKQIQAALLKKNINIFIKNANNLLAIEFIDNADKNNFLNLISKIYQNQLKNNKNKFYSIDNIKQNIIDNNISYLHTETSIIQLNNNDKCVKYTTFVGIALDIMSGLLFLLQKYNNICCILQTNYQDHPQLEEYYKSMGKINNNKKNYINFELLWSFHKLFYPLNFEENIKKCIKKSKYNFIIIPLGIEIFNNNHSNYLIYDISKNEIERFEPNGTHNPNKLNYNFKLLDVLLKNKFSEINNIKYIPPIDFLPRIGFQILDAVEKHTHQNIGDPGGFCAVWSIWYVDMRLKYNTIHRKELVESIIKLVKINNISFKNMIRTYSKTITTYRDDILKHANIDINNWIGDNLPDDKIDIVNNKISNIIQSLS
jgi:ankyrin repeat protein